MAEYNGTIDLISGIRPKNGGTFPLVNAHDIQTQEDDTRLDAELKALHSEDDGLHNDIEAIYAYGLSVVDGAVCQTFQSPN